MSPVGDPSGHWPAERLSGALDPHKPDRLVELCEPAVSDGFKEDGLAADPLAEPQQATGVPDLRGISNLHDVLEFVCERAHELVLEPRQADGDAHVAGSAGCTG